MANINNNRNKKEYKELAERNVKPFETNIFCDNTVCNSRYTALSFIPKNLYEQFRRPLNMYFLLVVILQFISIIAPVSPLSTLGPLVVAFAVTAVKEGFDDVKRHKSDDEYNNRKIVALRNGKWEETASCSIRVGDVIQIKQDQEIPCDCICVGVPSDEVQIFSPASAAAISNNNNNNNDRQIQGGTIYIRTENLDGEMDLKARDTPPTGICTETTPLRDVVNICNTLTFKYPPPSPSLSQFDAQIFVGAQKLPLTPAHMLFQSAYLKNIKHIFAIVIYTGNETRTGMNKKPAPQKWAAIDKCVSNYAILIFICQVTLALCLGLAGYIHNREDDTWYLGGATNGFDDTMRKFGGIIFPLRFFLLTSVMIPISFKFIVDVSKYWMSLVLEWDNDMKDFENRNGEGMKVKNSSIVEDLAQVQYVLSDKTGTLTQNIMNLHSLSTGHCSVYRLQDHSNRLTATPAHSKRKICAPSTSSALSSTRQSASHLYPQNSATQDATPAASSSSPSNFDILTNQSSTLEGHGSNNNNNNNNNNDHTFFNNVTAASDGTSSRLLQAGFVSSDMIGEDAPNLRELLLAMAITNTCTIGEEQHDNNNNSASQQHVSAFAPSNKPHHYQSPSPDEECLCQSAAAQGVILDVRTKKSMKVKISSASGPSFKTYTIHHVFEFSSDRKCMSIILTICENNNNDEEKTFLYSKGADDKILANLTPISRNSDRVLRSCDDVNSFAHQGLRTLMFARRRISKEELARFEDKYKEAQSSNDDRAGKVTKLQSELEQGMEFLGASGVEDKLQEDVVGTVQRILKGNMKFWMLTGDKVETAKQIAVSCGLFPASIVVGINENNNNNNNNNKKQKKGNTNNNNNGGGGGGGNKIPHPNLIEITGKEGFAKLGEMDPKSIQLPPGYEEAEAFAQTCMYPLSWFSAPILEHDHTSGNKKKNSRENLHQDLLGSSKNNNNHKAAAISSSTSDNNDNNEDETSKGMYLVVEGGAVLEKILANPLVTARLFEIAQKCVAVVCARVTPGQKATIAAQVKERGFMTLCVGDGGNDVAMIQEAQVGVGIQGREGQQAARAADFSIVNFKDLATLLFVHGHMSYMRTSYIVLYSFYKSMLISFIQILYNVFDAKLSGVSFWNSFVLTMWNGAFTLPQTIFFVLDICIPREVLVRYPILYRLSQSNYGFSPSRFCHFLFMGLLQSAFLLLFINSGFGGISGEDSSNSNVANPDNGRTDDLGSDFTAAYTALILLQVPLVFLYSSSMTGYNVAWILVMPGLYAVAMALYSVVKSLDYYHSWDEAATTPEVAWVVIVATILCLPPFLWKVFQELRAPDVSQLLRRDFIGGDSCFGSFEDRIGMRGSRGGNSNELLADNKGKTYEETGTVDDDTHSINSAAHVLPSDHHHKKKSSKSNNNNNDKEQQERPFSDV